MVGVFIEEKTIQFSQHIDLIYSLSGMLYDIILHSLQFLLNEITQSTTDVGQLDGKPSQLTMVGNPSSSRMTSKLTPSPEKTSKVNSVQSTQSKNLQQSIGKKKNILYASEAQQPQNPTTWCNKGKQKVEFPCMFCGKYHLGWWKISLH